MSRLIYCLLLMLAIEAVQAQPALEFKGDPAYGRLYDVTFDPAVANRVYALTLGNHVLQSNDKGATWQILYSFPGNDAFLKKMVVRPGNKLSFIVDYTQSADGVYILDIGTGEISQNYLLPVPQDASDHWVSSYSIQPGNANYAIMHQSYTIGLTGYAKVHVTADGGITWNEIYFTADNNDVFPTDVAICPVDPQRLYIARGAGFYEESGGLLVSQDGGATWTLHLPQINLHKIAVNPVDPTKILIGTGHGDHPQNLFRSSDHGNTWEVVNTTWSDGGPQSFSGIVYNQSNPANIIAMDGNEVAITTDAGENWTHYVYPDDDTSTYSYGTSASFNPFDQDEVFVGADWKPMFSTDGGATLVQLLTPFFQSTLAATFDGDQRHLYFGVQSGFVHTDLQTGVSNGHEIQPVDQMTSYDRPTYITDPNHEGRIYEYIDSISGATLYVSDDHGESKLPVYQTFFDSLIAMASPAMAPGTVWASLVSGVVLIDMTDPQNVQQTPIFPPVAGYVTSFLPGENPNEVLMGVGNRIYATNDAGANWTAMDNGMTLAEGNYIWEISRNPFNPNEMVAATSAGIFKTADNGQNWTFVYSGNNVRKARFSNKTNGHLIACENTTYTSMARLAYSVDGGNTWTQVPPELIAHSGSISMDFMFNEDNADVYVSTFDLGLVKFNLLLENLSVPDFGNQNLLSIHPNPAAGSINLSLKGANLKEFVIYDSMGKRAMESRTMEHVDISTLGTGTYFVRAESRDGKIFIARLVKI